jgi:hypothetical protein
MHVDPALWWTLLAEILLTAAILAAEIVRRRRAGAVLFNLGLVRPWGISSQPSPKARLSGLGFILSAEAFIAAAGRPVEIRQAGILAARLIRWNEIREYEVSPRGFLRLRLRDGAWRRFDVEIPEADQPGAASLLQSRVPAGET